MRVTIDRLGHLGDGVAEVGGAPVFVPMALPGEVVEGEVEAGRMAAPRIVDARADPRPGPLRALPRLRRLFADACDG